MNDTVLITKEKFLLYYNAFVDCKYEVHKRIAGEGLTVAEYNEIANNYYNYWLNFLG